MNRYISAALLLLAVAPLHAANDYPDVSALVSELGIEESAVASRDMPGWARPKKITIQPYKDIPAAGPGSADWIREATDGVEVEVLAVADKTPGRFAKSEVYVGLCSADAINDKGKLRYAHLLAVGIDPCMAIPGIADLPIVATSSARLYGDIMAEHCIALMLALSRNLLGYHNAQLREDWVRNTPADPGPSTTLRGRTLLVLGLGGVGTQVARRAHDLGMRVIATRNSGHDGPAFVDVVGTGEQMVELAAQADVVVNALPLTDATRGAVNAAFFAALKADAYYISVGRGQTTNTDALIAALSVGKLAGAGLDVTDPEPLPKGHKLWTMPNVIITPHVSGDADQGMRNMWVLARENLRRYVRGEKLLNVVDLTRGY
jgi:D-2-hydroxyacid dehydrogenase (NADP+)